MFSTRMLLVGHWVPVHQFWIYRLQSWCIILNSWQGSQLGFSLQFGMVYPQIQCFSCQALWYRNACTKHKVTFKVTFWIFLCYIALHFVLKNIFKHFQTLMRTEIWKMNAGKSWRYRFFKGTSEILMPWNCAVTQGLKCSLHSPKERFGWQRYDRTWIYLFKPKNCWINPANIWGAG